MVVLRSVILSFFCMIGVVVPVHSLNFVNVIVREKLNKYLFFGVGALTGFVANVAAEPDNWRDPAICSVAIASPAGMILKWNIDANERALGYTYTGEAGNGNRGLSLALGLVVGTGGGKILRYALAWLAHALSHKTGTSDTDEQKAHP